MPGIALSASALSRYCRLSHIPLFLIGVTAFLLLAAGLAPTLPVLKLLNHPPYGATGFSACLLIVILCVYCRALRQHPGAFIAAWTALLILFVFMIHKPVWLYQYDYNQNLATIEYYAKNAAIPNHDMLAESHQAPLYYTLAAIAYKLSAPFLGNYHGWLIVQDINFFFFAMFLLYGIVCFLEAIPPRFLAFAGIIMMLLWPGNILHSARISNNILIYLSFMGCAYHFMHWHKGRSLKELNRALLWMGVAFATQTSAIVLLAATVSLTAFAHVKGSKPSKWLHMLLMQQQDATVLRPLAAGLVVLVIGISAGYGRNFYNYLQDDRVSVIFGARTYSTTLIPSELLTLDIEQYIAYPYIITNAEQHSVNSQFWGYFLRSLSFGQFSWNGMQQAVIMNGLMLFMWCYLASGMLYAHFVLKKPLDAAGYFGVFLGYSLAAMATVKMLIHEWSYFWADARYIYAIMPLFLLCYLSLLAQLRNSHRPAYLLGLSLLLAYGGASFIHLYLQLAPMR